MANFCKTISTLYSSGQKAVSLTLGVACTLPLSSTIAMANGPMPFVPTAPTGAWQIHNAGGASFHTTSPNSSSSGLSQFASGGQTTPVHTNAAILARGNSSGLTAPSATGSVLNLASSSLSFLAGNLAGFQNMTINVGGHQEVVSLNSKLTGAEVVAAEQVLSGAGQTIKLTSSGVADGGSVSLNGSLLNALDSSVGGSISSLTIAKGVEVVDSLSVLSLSGGLSNYGSILTAAGTTGSADTITAGTILNAAGGAIGSYSGGNSGGGSGAGALVGATPILNAVTSITNNGSITSAGNLTISAPVVYNVASHGSAATISAADNVNISTANLTNTGTIAAIAGNINLASTTAGANLNITGTGGTLQANNGNINLSSNNADIDVNGSNMLSQQVNFNAGTGNVNANLDEATGVVNATGTNVHVLANTQDLQLGQIDATGDPLVANIGTVTITTAAVNPIFGATGGAPLTIVAGQNINSDGGVLDTSSTTGNGGSLTLIAGATFTGTALTGVTVTKGSATGGLIDLTGGNGGTGPVTTINSDSTSTGSSQSAGNIQIIAYAGTAAGSGSVLINTPITAQGTGAGSDGSVTVIAGAKSGQAVTTSAISAGTVAIDTATPTITLAHGGKGVGFDATGLATGTGTFAATKTPNAASITTGNVDASGVLNISTGGFATVANNFTNLNLGAIAVGKTGTFQASDSGGSINIGGIITGGTANISATGAGNIGFTGTGSVNTTSLQLGASATGTAIVQTNVSNLLVSSGGGDITVTQGANTLTLGGSGPILGNGSVTVTAPGQINVTGALAVGTVSGDTGNLSLTSSSKGGINIGAPITMQAGAISLTNSGSGKLTESAGIVLTADDITLNSDTSFGSKTVQYLTNTADILTVNAIGTKSANVIAYVGDQSTGSLTLVGNNPLQTTAIGGSLFFTSTATALNVVNANYNNVSITDTATGPSASGVLLGPISATPFTLGSGSGTFTVVSATEINANANTTVQGTTVTLTGNTGVGTSGQNIFVASPNLSLTSANGSVWVTDTQAATVNGSSSLNPVNVFSVTDSGAGAPKTGASLTVGKSVTGGNIDLATTGTGTLAVTGTLGTINTQSVTLTSDTGLTTKGAINGATIVVFASGGNLVVGGAIGGLASSVLLETGSPTVGSNSITVGGVITGTTIQVVSTGTVTTTKAITASGYTSLGVASSVVITGTNATAGANAITVGGVISGLFIELGSGTQAGGIAVNANVGTTAATVGVFIEAGVIGAIPATTGQLTGKGTIAGQNVNLEVNSNIGSAKDPILTQAVNLGVHPGEVNDSPAFITQKGNLTLNTAFSSDLVLKVTGTLNIAGTVTAPNLTVTTTGATAITGTITDGGTPGAISITSGGALTTSAASLIDPTGTTPTPATTVTINVNGAATLNGSLTAPGTLNLTTTGLLTVAGSLSGVTDNITSKGGINVGGTLGTGSDVFNISTTGAFTISTSPVQGGVVAGSGTITALTIANFGTATGSITYNATGTGNAFSNYGILGTGSDTVTVNAAKGTIYGNTGSVINAASLALNATSVNLTFAANTSGGGLGTLDITGATVKSALLLNDAGGNLTLGGAAVGSVTASSVSLQYSSITSDTVNLGSIATTNGNLLVSSSAQNLAVNAAATITSTNGNITLQNNNINVGANILVNAGATIHGSGAKANLNQGNVYIVMGAVPASPIAGTPPAGVTPTGTVFFGTNGITVSGTPGSVSLTGQDRNLVFNTGSSFSASAITLDSPVTITADPPAGSPLSVPAPSNNINSLIVPAAGVSTQNLLAASNTAAAAGALDAAAGMTNNTSGLLAAVTGLNAGAANNSGAFVIASGVSDALASGQSIDLGDAISAATTGAANPGISTSLVSSTSSDATVQNMVANTVTHGGGGKNDTAVTGKLSGGVSNILHQNLERGPLLLSPEQSTVIDTPFGSVSVAAGSVALIVSSEKGLAVYNLHDTHKNAVVIRHGSDTVTLMPGRIAVFARLSAGSFEEINPAPFVTYRHVGSSDSSGKARIYQADFDMMSMVRGLPAIKHLMASDHAGTKKTISNMIKTAAILSQLSASSEPYALYLTPTVTACALAAQR